MRRTPQFWNVSKASLQQSTFIVLGRIFDQRSPYNIDKLLGLGQRNIHIFSIDSLAKRKSLDPSHEYFRNVYTPTINDFRQFRKKVKGHRSIYNSKYRPIRDKLFAHKIIAESNEIDSLFSKTKIREMEKLLTFTWSVYNDLLQLYYNGRRPAFRNRGRYSQTDAKMSHSAISCCSNSGENIT
jgi:hypothetical protein